VVADEQPSIGALTWYVIAARHVIDHFHASAVPTPATRHFINPMCHDCWVFNGQITTD